MNVIEVKDLKAGYEKKNILTNVSFSIGQGEMVGIIGANGAGKSTLLKTLRGLLPIQGGLISLFDQDITSIDEKTFAKQVAYLQQHVEVPFEYTGKEIVIAGRYPYMKWWESETSEDEKIVKDCMEYTGVSDFSDKPVSELSGGQWQRILLAKVLAQKTPVLFLDEPTTGLDIVYQEEMFRFCKALSEKGKTVLMVVHELNLAYKFCSRLLLVGDGKILADGAPKTVLTEENLEKAYKTPLNIISHASSGGGIEINIKESTEEFMRKEELLKKICD